MKTLNKRLLRMIMAAKGQYIAVLIVIISGLMIYVALSTAAINLSETLDGYYEETNFADLYIETLKVSSNKVDELKNEYGFDMVNGRIVSEVPLVTEDIDERVNVKLVTIGQGENVNDVYLLEGRLIENVQEDVLVIQQFAEGRAIKIGDDLRPQINGKQYKLKVVGIVASSEYIYLMENEQSLLPSTDKFGVLYVSEEFGQERLGFGNQYNEVLIKLNENQNIDLIKDDLEEEFEDYGLKRIIEKEFQLSNRMISEEIKQLKSSSKVVPVLFLAIAGIILSMMISRMVKKDRTAIGVMKALGYSNLNMLSHYSKYSSSIGVLGGALGAIFGIVLSGYLTKMYASFFKIPMLKISFYYEYALGAILFSSIFCMISGFWGAKDILKIVPAESMRPEPPKSGKRIFLEKHKFFWNKVSFSWKVVIRNVLRNKKRMVFVSLGVALTYAMIFLTIYLSYASMNLFSSHFDEFLKMDYTINFSKPMHEDVIRELEKVIEIDHIEGKIEYPFELENGLNNKVVSIIGVEEDTSFYNFKDTFGNPVKVSNRGILISENLATALEVKKNDFLKINTFIPDREDERVKITGIIQQNLGINAYMEIETMDRLLLDQELVTGAYLNTSDDIVYKLRTADNIASIQSSGDLKRTFEEFLELTIVSISVMLVFSGILGFAIIYNATIMSINERELEFSSLRVLGLSKMEILKLILKENEIITILGISTGVVLGNIFVLRISQVFSNDLYTFNIPITWETYLVSLVVTLLFILLAQLATYIRIHKLNFLQALKSRIS